MAEMFRREFLARGRACRGGDGREVVEDPSGELRRWLASSMAYGIAWVNQERGEIWVMSEGSGNRERAKRTAGSTATFPLAVVDLSGDPGLLAGFLFSAKRR
jgi:hypothetical protein